LNWLKENGNDKNEIEIKSDSKLLIKQMQGKWGIKAGLYFDDAVKAKLMINDFLNIKFTWIPREQNLRADGLSRLALKKEQFNQFKNVS